MDKKSSPNTHSTPKKRKKITQTYLENAGAYYLERFSASVASFRRVMERKITLSCRDHPDQDKDACLTMLDNVTEKFIKLGYLNDEHYARNLVNTLHLRGQSHSRVKQGLAQKGLSKDLIAEVMPERDPEQDKDAAIKWARKRRLGPFALRTRDNDMARGLSSLARAGFDYDIAHWVMHLSKEEIEGII